MKAPVLYIVFNRPEITQITFDRLRAVKPEKLYVVADGPRDHVPADKEKCAKVRNIVKAVDWDCETHYLFRDENLGCGKGVSSGISWFFEHVEQGIILEDDCYPGDDFFGYIETVLNQYADNSRVMMVSGCNFQEGNRRTDCSYFFSRACHIWGWGTWRRAWKKYDFDMKNFAAFKKSQVLKNILNNPDAITYWSNIFEKMSRHEIDTWDYQWVYAIMAHDGLSVYPEANLVKNIGFGADATHTTDENNNKANMETKQLLPVIHPEFIFPNRDADTFSDAFVFGVIKPKKIKKTFSEKLLKKITRSKIKGG